MGANKERSEYQLLNTVFKALHYNDWLSYLKPDIHNPTRTLRSSRETTLKVPLESGTFQDSASNVFNSLPSAAGNSTVFSDFKTNLRKYLINRAKCTFDFLICIYSRLLYFFFFVSSIPNIVHSYSFLLISILLFFNIDVNFLQMKSHLSVEIL